MEQTNVEGQESATSNENVADKVETTETTTEQPQMSADELMAKLNALESTNARLLEESKKNKLMARQVKEQKEREEQEKLKAEGDYKALLETSEEKRRRVEKAALSNLIKYEVSKHAGDARDMDDIVAFLPSEHIEIDRENMKVSGVSEAVKALKESKPYLFGAGEKIGMETKRPESKPPKEKTIDDFSLSELKGAIGKLVV